MHGRRVLTGLAAVSALLVLAGAPVAAGGGWSAPQQFEDDAGSSYVDRPAVVVQAGKTYVAVAARGPSPGIRLFTIDANGTTISHVTARRDRQPALAISDSGVLHLAFWRRGTGCTLQPCSAGIFHARSSDGQTWTVDRVHAGRRDVHPSLSLDPTGKPWIYFRAGNRIIEAHKSQGEWSNAEVGFGCCGPDPLAGPEAIVAGGQGRVSPTVHPTGLSPFSRLTVYRDSFNGGAIVFSIFETDFIDQRVVTEADDAFDPDLVLDADGELHVVYRREGNGLWHAEVGQNGNFVRTKIANAEIVGAPAIVAFPDVCVLVVAATANRLIYRTNCSSDSWTGGSIPMTVGDPSAPGVAATPSGAARVAFLRDPADGFWLTRHSASWD